MKQSLFIMMLFISSILYSQNKAFSYLDSYIIDYEYGIEIHYNKDKSSEVQNIALGKLSKDHPMYSEEEFYSSEFNLLLQTEVSKGKKYFVVFTYGPSMDMEYLFYSVQNPTEVAFSLSTEKIYIPGNGSIYTSGIMNSKYNTKKKFKLTNGDLKEVEQAFYSVGLKTNTIKSIQLFETTDCKNVVANLPENYAVEVLIHKKDTDFYLIKTEFGLIGWAKIPISFMHAETIEGIYQRGD